jgi:cell division protein FtsQ
LSDQHGHDPDPAALDELQRAFGRRSDAAPARTDRRRARDGREATEPPVEVEQVTDAASEPAEILIVEQAPLVDPADATPTPPTIIRIDDYSGSKIIDRVVPDPARPAPTRAPVPGVTTDGRATDHADGRATDHADGRATDHADGRAPAVIGIEDEDLPDAVYVAGDLARSGARTIVFIEDDDTGDTVAPEIDRNVRRGIEPRLRERRAAVKRALGRKRLRWLLLGTVVVIVGVGTLAVLGSDLFAIKQENVTVYGAVYADPALVEAVVDDLVGTPALLVDTQTAERALEAIPWVDTAKVRVSFPHTATIEIREREAQTTYQGPDQRYRVLDRDGRVLDVLDGYPIAYVLLAGPDPVDLDPGEFAPQGYAAASELAKNLTASIRGRVERIDVTADGSQLSLFLDDGTEARFGQARDIFNKLLRLETTLANNPDREPGVIDVSTREVTL